MAKSLNDMILRIIAELGARTDLAPTGSNPTVITNAISDAIQIYQKERFRFNELAPLSPLQFTTTANVAFYDATLIPALPLLYKIDYVNYLLGVTTQKMERRFPEEIYLALQAGSTAGPPATFGWDGQSLVIYPSPNTGYLMTIGGYMAVAAPTDPDDTTNPWMNDAEMLIRSRAKYEIAMHFTRNDKMVAAMSPDFGSGGACERYYGMLKGEANKIRGTGVIRGMRF